VRWVRTAAGRCLSGWVLCGTLVAPAGADEPQKVAFNAADGFWIHADYYGPRGEYQDAPLAILLQAERVARDTWAPLVKPLREAGFVVLVPDLRGCGQSATTDTRRQREENDPKLFRDMQEDLRGAYDYLAKQKGVDRARFGLVAVGAAAGVATRYAVLDRSVDVVVCVTPAFTQPGLDPLADLGQLRGRKILVVSSRDERTTTDQLPGLPEGVETHAHGSTAQGMALLAAEPKVNEQIADYLVRGVGKPSKTVVFGSIRTNIYHSSGSGWVEQIDPTNLRHYSSPQEAESRGLRAAKSTGPEERRPEKNRPRPKKPKPP